jgi:hypothetical protein
MMGHAAAMAAIIAAVMLCGLLPFLPGRYDPLTFRLGTSEIVMYNPKDEHAIVSHNSDTLRRQMPQRSGFYAMNDAREPRWQYFWFD